MTKNVPVRLLGFDFGTKRIGVAIGQTITRTARPLSTLPAKNGKPSLEEIASLLKKWQPDALVVGIPLNMDGTEQKVTHLAREFADNLREQFKLPVYGVDERLTTREARDQIFAKGGYKALQNKEIDGVAAQLILETWFMQIEN